MVLAAPDKAGKSTLMAHAMTALTRGTHFLGKKCERGTGILVGLEEALGDAVGRFQTMGADLTRIQLAANPAGDLLEELETQLQESRADLIVVDSLIEYARRTKGTAPQDGDNSAWSEVMRPLVGLARKHNVATVLLHHARRADGAYRGAGEIAAAADALLEMSVDQADPTARIISGRGRWAVETFRARYVDPFYELADQTAIPLAERVRRIIERSPNVGVNEINNELAARRDAVQKAIMELLQTGTIVRRKKGQKYQFRLAELEPKNLEFLEDDQGDL